MKLLSLEPFVPSGKDFEKSKQFFLDLGFTINWDSGGYVGFQKDECRFILQHFDRREFAENFMLSVKVADIHSFSDEVASKQLVEKYGIKITPVTQQPYGKEVTVIDRAGVCWHFVQQ
jgi:hypothetical protein